MPRRVLTGAGGEKEGQKLGGEAVVLRDRYGAASNETEGHVRSGLASEPTGRTMADYKGVVFLVTRAFRRCP